MTPPEQRSAVEHTQDCINAFYSDGGQSGCICGAEEAEHCTTPKWCSENGHVNPDAHVPATEPATPSCVCGKNKMHRAHNEEREHVFHPYPEPAAPDTEPTATTQDGPTADRDGTSLSESRSDRSHRSGSNIRSDRSQGQSGGSEGGGGASLSWPDDGTSPEEATRPDFGISGRAAAPDIERPRRITTRGSLAQALLATELIDRLLDYSKTGENRQQLAWSWAIRIGDWLDEVNGSWAAQAGPPPLDEERLHQYLHDEGVWPDARDEGDATDPCGDDRPWHLRVCEDARALLEGSEQR